ncbi:hypothetical protein [Herbaspirillum sp.]|jgi:hypothetical protein|uniref:hypothetical protein n=1 Tax=Herbaspirillum TaxID=963 RepID=UPI002585A31D|nr:hypothetical protein [Herbaspirillum sp.]MCP3658672.1 hypothetical protein [Herbaspirillum sp.]MCP3948890.1 hypothetical protein [Herbaspirillum sp.]MCP4030163.1 hypothetical protein [Herbaspirillum sp.]MCP4555467.1 hypothetical protein [Herbaspirillum sp.]
MSHRRLLNVPRHRQQELAARFAWLPRVHENEKDPQVQVISVSVFDHWLSPEEACQLLEAVPPDERKRRDALMESFCKRMIAETEVLSYALRGRKKDRLVFRTFNSSDALTNYCRPNGAKSLGHREWHVVLPELECAFLEGWDHTCHFFFVTPGIEEKAMHWAAQSKVHILRHTAKAAISHI